MSAEDAAAFRDFEQRGGIANLSARTKIVLTGADRVRYLNGQVTANVARLQPGATMRACVTTAKGKLNADVVLTALGGRLLVDAEPELRESLSARLERYIIADDVTLDDATEGDGLFHFLPAPGRGWDSLRGIMWSPVDSPITSQRFGRPGFDIWLPIDAIAAQVDFFSEHHAILEEPLLESLRIEAGIPRWGRELDENTLPPEAGLDRTHIDYHKGCYIGQEVISRLKSVGHVNRTLTGFVSPTGAPLAPGAPIFASGDDAKPAGEITSAAWSHTLSAPIALGYLRRGTPADGLTARLAGGAPVPVVVRALPALEK